MHNEHEVYYTELGGFHRQYLLWMDKEIISIHTWDNSHRPVGEKRHTTYTWAYTNFIDSEMNVSGVTDFDTPEEAMDDAVHYYKNKFIISEDDVLERGHF